MTGETAPDNFALDTGTVLVVDDNTVNITILTRFLNRNGYKSIGAESGAEALELIKTHNVDLILLDLFMPGMSGFDVIQVLKADAQYCEIPVIFISANEDAEHKIKAFQLGAVDYMSKPYHVQEVLARVQIQLTIFKQRREIEHLRAIDQQRLQELSADIAHREAMERELRQSRASFEQLVNSIQEVFWLLDIESENFVYLSPAFERWGFDPKPLYEDGWRIKDMVHPQDWQELGIVQDNKNIKQLLDLSKSKYISLRITNGKDTHWIRTRFFPVFNSEGKLYRVAGVAEDFTERKVIEEQQAHLELQEQRVNVLLDFFTNVSHEFRTPLSIIQTRSYLLKRSHEHDEKLHKDLHIIEEQVNAITDLIDSLGWMTRLDSGQVFDLTPIDVNHTLRYLMESYLSWGEAKHIAVKFTPIDTAAHVYAEAGILRRLFDEVVENAVQFTPEHGIIDLVVRAKDNTVYVTVTDSGTGIPEGLKSRIFERFYRADASHTTRGFGLGLAIARKIANLLGGDITVSNTPSQGAKFTISLPLAEGESANTRLM